MSLGAKHNVNLLEQKNNLSNNLPLACTSFHTLLCFDFKLASTWNH